MGASTRNHPNDLQKSTMDIQKLSEIFDMRTAKYFRLAAQARTQAQVNAAMRAQGAAARAGVRLDAARAAL